LPNSSASIFIPEAPINGSGLQTQAVSPFESGGFFTALFCFALTPKHRNRRFFSTELSNSYLFPSDRVRLLLLTALALLLTRRTG
jgi:hypothetical protein